MFKYVIVQTYVKQNFFCCLIISQNLLNNIIRLLHLRPRSRWMTISKLSLEYNKLYSEKYIP